MITRESGICPDKYQLKQIERRFGMFIHFGINTFANCEWSDGQLDKMLYNPSSLDCDGWVKTAAENGMKYVIITAKHHDGFCIWNTDTTEYCVKNTACMTDVIAEVSKACKKYGISLGIYYSLWDRNSILYKENFREGYLPYMRTQIYELLTHYGDICELWLDGSWDKPGNAWEFDILYDMVKNINPSCQIGINHTIGRNTLEPEERYMPERCIEGDPIRMFPSDFRLWDPKIAHKLDKKRYLYQGESYYLPFEHTLCISKAWTWFQKEKNLPVRSLDELEELFYWCTDNNNTLVINIPPDKTGNIREYEANAIMELAKRIGIKKDKPLPKNGELLSLNSEVVPSSVFQENIQLYGGKYATDGGMQTLWRAADTIATLTIMLPQKPFNKISIFEACEQHVAPDGFTTERLNRILKY